LYALGFLADLQGVIKTSASKISIRNGTQRGEIDNPLLRFLLLARGIKASAPTEG
jgi:hypothetical protein